MAGRHPIDETLRHLAEEAGKPALQRCVGRDGAPIAAFAAWSHGGGRFDLGGLRTTQVVMSLTSGQKADLRGERLHKRSTATAGEVGIVIPSVSPTVAISGRAVTLQVILADSLLTAARHLPRDTFDAMRLRALGAQALVALTSIEADGECCGRIAMALARMVVAGTGAEASSSLSRGGLRPHVMRRVCEVMCERLARRPDRLPGNEELAALAGLSPFHFVRAFHISTGRTPHVWLMDQRIARAYALLLSEGAAVGDVAEQTGFSSPAHFVSAFRTRNGVTPAVLRDAARIPLGL